MVFGTVFGRRPLLAGVLLLGNLPRLPDAGTEELHCDEGQSTAASCRTARSCEGENQFIERTCGPISVMSASGTKRTWRDVRHESAFGGKAENIYSALVTH